jgi:hypothetical protein
MKFNEIVSEGGFLTTEGKKLMDETVLNGVSSLIMKMSDKMTKQEQMLLKGLLMNVLSEKMSSYNA